MSDAAKKQLVAIIILLSLGGLVSGTLHLVGTGYFSGQMDLRLVHFLKDKSYFDSCRPRRYGGSSVSKLRRNLSNFFRKQSLNARPIRAGVDPD